MDLRFMGGLLMAAGILVASLSGLCALAMLSEASYGLHSPAERAISANAMPMLVGLGITFAGWILRRS